ncbi:hypothetical protein L596_026461 [Steinernema carpocapsae]|uniref:Uncharacterized protein n=1 Tax=Steinernema carpocapsae TaxID=34508 RepID=A0A4U5M1F9_STECR|nr:hypothetical protein L596_026461 [Steinernema carpocapsae]
MPYPRQDEEEGVDQLRRHRSLVFAIIRMTRRTSSSSTCRMKPAVSNQRANFRKSTKEKTKTREESNLPTWEQSSKPRRRTTSTCRPTTAPMRAPATKDPKRRKNRQKKKTRTSTRNSWPEETSASPAPATATARPTRARRESKPPRSDLTFLSFPVVCSSSYLCERKC